MISRELAWCSPELSLLWHRGCSRAWSLRVLYIHRVNSFVSPQSRVEMSSKSESDFCDWKKRQSIVCMKRLTFPVWFTNSAYNHLIVRTCWKKTHLFLQICRDLWKAVPDIRKILAKAVLEILQNPRSSEAPRCSRLSTFSTTIRVFSRRLAKRHIFLLIEGRGVEEDFLGTGSIQSLASAAFSH